MTRLLLNRKLLLGAVLLILSVSDVNEDEVCMLPGELESNNTKCSVDSQFSRNRYILYDVSYQEGFNLRRDVYVRVAVFMKDLVEEDQKFQWKLVLPRMGNLYHWRTRDIQQSQVPWGTFFDLESLNKYIPVIEMQEFIEEYSRDAKETALDVIYILQNDEEMFKTGKFKDKNLVKECDNDTSGYFRTVVDKHGRQLWKYKYDISKSIKCITFHGTISGLKQNLDPSVHRTVMFDHMEIALHNYYGSHDYWTARRSMRYNTKLYAIANEFRKNFLNSTDENDNTERPKDWTQEKGRRTARGGPYLCVHLRRRDFVISRSSSIPTIKQAASQLRRKLDELSLRVLFVATDTTIQEFEELQAYLHGYTVLKYNPTNNVMLEFKDGGVSILDQIICSHARYFIGTHESTFSFRIQEDREIIGFPPETTFNRLCSNSGKCSPPSRWEIVW